MTRPTFPDLNPDDYNPVLCYYPFIVKLNRCNSSCERKNPRKDYACNKYFILVIFKVENI